MDKTKLILTIEAAMQAFIRLEQALSDGDQRKIGARLAELRWELKNIQRLAGNPSQKENEQ